MSRAYYNEHDAYAAEWLRALIRDGLIADGDVDERSIIDVRPTDLAGYSQCHFFAGIGGWSYALRLAGWPDEHPVWTGSCPCQPFSAAGKGLGKDDARHLWPQFRRLIRQCRPAVVFGEQVASKAGRVWLSGVFADLEALAYRAAGADLCGPCVGAFDIRQRLWFVADTRRQRRERQRLCLRRRESRESGTKTWGRGKTGALADTGDTEWRPVGVDGQNGRDGQDVVRPEAHGESRARGEVRGLADRQEHGRRQGAAQPARRGEGTDQEGAWVGPADDRGSGWVAYAHGSGPEEQQRGRIKSSGSTAADFWRDVEWLPCSDGKWRPTQPGLFPLAHGVRGRMAVRRAVEQAGTTAEEEHWYSRVGALRGFGNAIKPQVAAEFILAYIEAVIEIDVAA